MAGMSFAYWFLLTVLCIIICALMVGRIVLTVRSNRRRAPYQVRVDVLADVIAEAEQRYRQEARPRFDSLRAADKGGEMSAFYDLATDARARIDEAREEYDTCVELLRERVISARRMEIHLKYGPIWVEHAHKLCDLIDNVLEYCMTPSAEDKP